MRFSGKDGIDGRNQRTVLVGVGIDDEHQRAPHLTAEPNGLPSVPHWSGHVEEEVVARLGDVEGKDKGFPAIVVGKDEGRGGWGGSVRQS